MTAIDIDFDLFKTLTNMRSNEQETISDVIRKALAALEEPAKAEATEGGLTIRGILFPNGTKFRATYKGQSYLAEIKDGRWLDQAGATRSSPSDAVRAITNTNVNGWRFWFARRPGEQHYQLMDNIRP